MAVVCLTVTAAGCDYSGSKLPPIPNHSGGSTLTGSNEVGATSQGDSSRGGETGSESMKPMILESIVSLIQTAALKPGGDNFKLATLKLNTYFEDVPRELFRMKPEVRDYLKSVNMPEHAMAGLDRTTFELPDSRHLEDCLLYRNIATRVAGNGEDLVQVERVFDWMVRQIQLVPAGSLAPPGLLQAQVRPYDMLLRGLATEAEGGWSERGWLFMSLCRQLGFDVALLTYQPANEKEPHSWICGVLLNGKIYLFDQRLGMAVPGPDGKGVATLKDALDDPSILARLNVPGAPPYQPDHALLAAPTTKIGALIDSSPGYYAPRMLLLEKSLPGKYQTVLYRDPIEERDLFREAIGAGEKLGDVAPWPLPMTVATLLFTSGDFVQATQHTLFLLRPEFPLVYARIKQLRGDLSESITDYMTLRFPDVPLLMDKQTPMPQEIQDAMNMYSAYYLALAHLELAGSDPSHYRLATQFFKATLNMLPEPGPQQPFYYMFRWGAQANLAKLYASQGESDLAIAYASEKDPTAQHQSSLILARDLILSSPFAPIPKPLPAAPKPPSAPPPGIARPQS